MNKIYLDYASSTYVDLDVKKEMDRYFSEEFGNPGSFHSMGLNAKQALDNARQKISNILHCRSSEIIFTGSGTESINLAIQGLAKANKDKKHIITSAIEHHSVLNTCKYLEKEEGYEVTYIKPDQYGIIDPDDIEKAIRDNTLLVTIMYANNEIGTIQDISKIGKICHDRKVYFHTDACQAAGYLDLDVNKLNVDLMSLNGSKIYAPKGTGVLFKRQNIHIKPIIYGGGQEFNLRSGTENIPGIIAFAKALELSCNNRDKEVKRLTELRNYLIKNIIESISGTYLNGHQEKRLPNNVNLTIKGVDADALIMILNENGIYASTGSACSSRSIEPSHVLLSVSLSYQDAKSSIRFSLGKKTSKHDIDRLIEILPKIVKDLRFVK